MDTQEKTIKDFGDQWGVYTTNDGYYASTELFQDILGPLLSINEIKNSKVIDVGSGTGRIMKMILDCGADFAVGIEPSDAFFVLKENLRSKKENILLLHIRGDEINFNNEFDYAFSIGVLHHIPNPNKTVKNIYDSLKINGRFIFWVYGKEGNSIYLTIILFIRKITTIIPHKILENFVNILDIFLYQ